VLPAIHPQKISATYFEGVITKVDDLDVDLFPVGLNGSPLVLDAICDSVEFRAVT